MSTPNTLFIESLSISLGLVDWRDPHWPPPDPITTNLSFLDPRNARRVPESIAEKDSKVTAKRFRAHIDRYNAQLRRRTSVRRGDVPLGGGWATRQIARWTTKGPTDEGKGKDACCDRLLGLMVR